MKAKPEGWGGRKKFGEVLESMRDAAGFTQDALAKKMGVKQSSLSHCESGERLMSFPTWLRCCEACKFDPRWFLDKLGVKRRRKRKKKPKQEPEEG